jgi:hypothetical protein
LKCGELLRSLVEGGRDVRLTVATDRDRSAAIAGSVSALATHLRYGVSPRSAPTKPKYRDLCRAPGLASIHRPGNPIQPLPVGLSGFRLVLGAARAGRREIARVVELWLGLAGVAIRVAVALVETASVRVLAINVDFKKLAAALAT